MNIKLSNLRKSLFLEFKKGNKKIAIEQLEKYNLINSKDINARLDLAYMYLNSNQLSKAILQYKLILKLEENITAMFNLAICLSNKNEFKNSINILKKIIKKDKSHFKALRALGDILLKIKNYNLAFKYLSKANKLETKDPILLNSLGAVEMNRGKLKSAKIFFDQSIKLDQTNNNTLNNLAAFYQKIGQNEDSLKIYESLSYKFPNNSHLLNNKGNVLIDLNRNQEAVKVLKRAIKLNPKKSYFYSNLGRSFFFLKNYKDAENAINTSLILDPKNHEARLLFFYLLIINNKLKNAWKYFESRLKVKNYFIPENLCNFNSSIFLKNKKILILREAGIGDEILYSSMYLDLIKKNKNIFFECDKRLKKIFENSFNYKKFISKTKTVKEKKFINTFDHTLYAGSLPMIFRNKISDFKIDKYLKPNKKKSLFYKKKLSKINTLPKIGISWISKRLSLGKDKSIDLLDLLPVLKRNDLSFVNLQYGDYHNEIEDFNSRHKINIIDMPELDKFNDIESLLALISQLDLVLTVSNSTAHLSGSIGKKTLLLAPTNRAQLFYWMFYKNKTPWYPSINIIKKNEKWNEVILKLNNNLDKIFTN
tara:strand:+ start:249 stop:2033 length:1785 start_codon:yes stop_codon:yes gene_type:complete